MKYTFKIVKLKKILYITFFIFVLLILFIFSEINSESIKNSYNIFINLVFPALFPFILFTEFVSNTNILDTICNKSKKIINKIFPISNYSTSPILIGFLCGFPTGAKIIRKFYDEKKLTFEQANVLLSFTNNCSPIFVYTTVGIMIFSNSSVGLLLLISHILANVIIGFIYSRKHISNIIHENSKNLNTKSSKTFDYKEKLSFFENLKNSIIKTFISLVNILGFIIFFNLLATNLKIISSSFISNTDIIDIIASIFEITNGITTIFSCATFNIEFKIIFSSFLLGFSGICIIFQIYSVIYEANFSLKKLLVFKLLHGIISCIITSFIIYINNFLQIVNIYNTENVFNNIASTNFVSTILNYKDSYIILICLIIILVLFTKQKKIAK